MKETKNKGNKCLTFVPHSCNEVFFVAVAFLLRPLLLLLLLAFFFVSQLAITNH